MASLWGEEFTVSTVEATKKAINKINKPIIPKTKKALSSKLDLSQQLSAISMEVYRILGTYKDRTRVIYDIKEFEDYINTSIKNGIIAIDTETNNSLDPITCLLMGACVYTPGEKNVYIPVNHVNADTHKKLSNQITEIQIKEQFQRLIDNNVKIIMHNGKFDYEVIKCTCDIELPIYWDTLIGAKVLDENERVGLKEQYITKIDSSIEKYSIEHLFEKVEYAVVDPDVFALYAATDSFMTYKLYEYQVKKFAEPDNQKLFTLFRDIEMPIVIVSAEMELTGISLDAEYSKRLSIKYHRLLDECEQKISEELKKYTPIINDWKKTEEAFVKIPKSFQAYYHIADTDALAKAWIAEKHKQSFIESTDNKYLKSKAEKLDDPISISSPTQLSILFYDILKIDSKINKDGKKETGEDALTKIGEKYADVKTLCDLILESRGLVKLINTYIDKLPKSVSQKDNRLHAHFNQFGAATGRFSSSEPNLQNIPSHNNEIRMMFTASPGYILCGSDYSQQEPRLLANYSQDENMIQAYIDGKDLYATIASVVYHNNYEDNKEFYPDGTMNPEGKARRTSCKSLILGIMYGRGTASIAEQIKTHKGPVTKEDIDEAQKITNNFFSGFPKVKDWIEKTKTDAQKTGYVEDAWGRRRRLPDLLRDKYEISFKNGSSTDDFNPLLGSKNIYINSNAKIIEKYKKLCYNAKSKKDIDDIKSKALKENIIIKDNGGFISQAERQCVNARVQGGSASMSKKAMIAVHNDSKLNSLGFRLLIAIHDELVGECPIENQEAVKKRLSELMINAAKPECTVPMKCDADSFPSWYYDVYTSKLKETYEKMCKSMPAEEAFKKLYSEHEELTKKQLAEMLNT